MYSSYSISLLYYKVRVWIDANSTLLLMRSNLFVYSRVRFLLQPLLSWNLNECCTCTWWSNARVQQKFIYWSMPCFLTSCHDSSEENEQLFERLKVKYMEFYVIEKQFITSMASYKYYQPSYVYHQCWSKYSHLAYNLIKVYTRSAWSSGFEQQHKMKKKSIVFAAIA